MNTQDLKKQGYCAFRNIAGFPALVILPNDVRPKVLRTFSICLMIVLFTASLPSFSQTQTFLLHNNEKLLFVGNGNVGSEGGLQNHFRRTVAGARPPLTVQTEWLSMYNRPTLSDMYTDELVQKIRTGDDSLLVVQSGTDAAMQKFISLAEESHKAIIIFSEWAGNPVLDPEGMRGFRNKTEAQVGRLRQFQKLTSVPVVPTGLIWYDLLAHPVPFKGLREDYLFVPGSSVQNDLGTLVNVAAIYAGLTGKSPVGLPFWTAFPLELVREIQERVWQLMQDWNNGTAEVRPLPAGMEVPAWPAIVRDGDHILYVGNSFIGTEGGLDNHFRGMTPFMKPPLNIQTRSIIYWGQGLSRMYTDSVLEAIGSRQNDLVVVTSGPPELLKKFRDTIVASGSRMMIHMTWGLNPVINKGGMASFRKQTVKIVEDMEQFEKETGVPVAPCGLVFYDLVADPPDIPGLRTDWVFMVENIHQNHIGTMVNAAVHYAVMTGRSPVGLPMWDPYPPGLIKAVQERAWQIVQEWKAGHPVIKPLPGKMEKPENP